MSFRAFGIPVSVGPAIVVGLLGLGLLSRLDGAALVAWVALGFVALLAHELGHALMFRRFGVRSSISFFVLGGLTTPENGPALENLSHGRSAIVSLGGPVTSLAIGLISLAIGIGLAQLGLTVPREDREIVFVWLFVNVAWGVFNLLPISALDGGQALRHLLGAAAPGRLGVVLGVGANLLASVAIAGIALRAGQAYLAIVALLFGLGNPGLYADLLDAIAPSHRQPPNLPTNAGPRPEPSTPTDVATL